MPLVKLDSKKIYLIRDSKIKFSFFKIIPPKLKGKVKRCYQEQNKNLFN